jgi:HSP20 family protein
MKMDRDDRKRKIFFDKIFGIDNLQGMDEIFDCLNRVIGINIENFGQNSFVYGFSVTHRREEGLQVREFGNIPTFEQIEIGDKRYLDIRKPLIDILETEDTIHVIAEIPGIEKENIILNATDLILDIKTIDGNPKYSELVELHVKVDPLSAKATYKNGVLEVTFKRLESSSRSSIDIE